ncbi:Probable actin-related protein 2/3 complex subunit 2 [Anthophora plagiata]
MLLLKLYIVYECGPYLIAEENGYNISVPTDLKNLPEDWELFAKKELHTFANVYEKYFDFQEEYYNSAGTQFQKRAVI